MNGLKEGEDNGESETEAEVPTWVCILLIGLMGFGLAVAGKVLYGMYYDATAYDRAEVHSFYYDSLESSVIKCPGLKPIVKAKFDNDGKITNAEFKEIQEAKEQLVEDEKARELKLNREDFKKFLNAPRERLKLKTDTLFPIE